MEASKLNSLSCSLYYQVNRASVEALSHGTLQPCYQLWICRSNGSCNFSLKFVVWCCMMPLDCLWCATSNSNKFDRFEVNATELRLSKSVFDRSTTVDFKMRRILMNNYDNLFSFF